MAPAYLPAAQRSLHINCDIVIHLKWLVPLSSSSVVASPVAPFSSYILQRAGCFPACDKRRQVFLFVLCRESVPVAAVRWKHLSTSLLTLGCIRTNVMQWINIVFHVLTLLAASCLCLFFYLRSLCFHSLLLQNQSQVITYMSHEMSIVFPFLVKKKCLLLL